MRRLFSTGDMIKCLERLGYKIERVSYEGEIDRGFFAEPHTFSYYSVTIGGEDMNDVTGCRKEGTDILEFIFFEELKNNLMKLF